MVLPDHIPPEFHRPYKRLTSRGLYEEFTIVESSSGWALYSRPRAENFVAEFKTIEEAQKAAQDRAMRRPE